MIKPLHSSRTGSARPAEYTIKQANGRFRIYDKQQRFRCEFATLAAAQAYIESRTSHNNVLSDDRQAVPA
jgi:hypothetical protein